MILYFTGTGNSRYAAQELAKRCNDELVSMNRIMRQRKLDPYNAQYAFTSKLPFVIVCPTYCWHVPKVVEEFLYESRFVGSTEMYFFLTCGSGTGKAEEHAKAICHRLELKFMGLTSAIMPENYITLFRAPDADTAVGMVRAVNAQAETAAGQILSHRPFADSNSGIGMPDFMCRLFYKKLIHDRLFTVKETCIGCGTCVRLCPRVNITLRDRRPVWHGDCTQCQACVAVCPVDAIEFGRRTKGKRRYYLFADGRQKFPTESPSADGSSD